ncbi:class I SAM-dependent methyltransferase [Streptoverticillium reticulum]|uniref:class I SAM-dependent methyltransferase n=1 Tax=Streptoverticillium reticulum TaxID=1433415 RepID=UPI0039BF8DBD
MVNNRYRQSWEGFWSEASDAPGEVLWDADPSVTSQRHLELLTPHIDPALPIVDVGCGNGTQTRYLATRFARVVGVDLSQAAVEYARRVDATTSAEFEQLNLADIDEVRALHKQLGDVNVYMRAVLHQCDPEDRAPVAAAVAELVGARGRAFVLEVASTARQLIEELARQPSEQVVAAVAHDLKPARTEPGEVEALLRGAGLEVLASGAAEIVTTLPGPDGGHGALPGEWFVAGRG